MNVQAGISRAKLQKKIGQTLQVLVDEAGDDGVVARSKADAPEIDGLVYLSADTPLDAGDIVSVEIVNADAYDLFARVV